MVDELKNKLDEDGGPGYTSFGGRASNAGSYFSMGSLSAWFSKFFTKQGAKEVGKQATHRYDGPLQGDVVTNQMPLAPTSNAATFAINRTQPFHPEIEVNRRKRYQEYEQMDEYPEATTAFDIYADDASQRNLKGERWKVKTKSLEARDEVLELFQKIKLDKIYWDIIRNTCKYGDTFMELVLDINHSEAGIQKIKILNPNHIIRRENEYGHLVDFLQEIPDESNYDLFGPSREFANNAKTKYISLDRNQLVHARLHTSEPRFYPYGRGVAAGAIRIFRSLKLMEDAMLVYRLARAPERRIFYIDTGRLPSNKAEAFIERVKDKFKKEKYFGSNGSIDARYNPLSADEDYFVPVKGSNSGTKIETLEGAKNLGEVDDVKYFREKFLDALKVPKDFVYSLNEQPDRGSGASTIDVRFARAVMRIQHEVEVALEAIAKRHLKMKHYPPSIINALRIELPDPSHLFTKAKLEIEEQNSRVVQALVATGLFSKRRIYKEYYDMSDEEIEELTEELEKEMEREQELMPPPPTDAVGAPIPGAQPQVNPAPKPAMEDLEKLQKVKLLAESSNSPILKRFLKRVNMEC